MSWNFLPYCIYYCDFLLNFNMYVDGIVKLIVFCAVYFSASIVFKLEAYQSSKDVVCSLLNKTRKIEKK